jgi:hypothetical protein
MLDSMMFLDLLILEKNMANYSYARKHLFVFFPSYVYVILSIIYANLDLFLPLMNKDKWHTPIAIVKSDDQAYISIS